MTNESSESMSIEKIERAARHWDQLQAHISTLKDEAEHVALPLERSAQKIASAEHKIKRTTSWCHFSGIGADGRAAFEIIDGYDDSFEGSVSYSFEQLADPDAAIAEIRSRQQEAARKRAEDDLARAERRLAQITEECS